MAAIHLIIALVWNTCILLPWIQGVTPEDLCPLDTLDCSQDGFWCIITRDPGCALTTQGDTTPHTDPSAVADLNVRPYYLPSPTTEDSISRVEITWSLSTNNTRDVTGFSVRLHKEGNSPYCFIFNTSGISHGKQKYQYLLNCTMLHKGDYVISVSSLPGNGSATMWAVMKIAWKERDARADSCRGSSASSCWNTDVVVFLALCSRHIRVLFPQAPGAVGIEYYQIALMNSTQITAETSVRETQRPGKQFVDKTIDISSFKFPLRNQHVEIIPRGRICVSTCMDSVSPQLDILRTDVSGCLAEPPDSDSPISKSTVLAVTGVVTVVVIALAVVLAVAIKHCRCHHPKGLEPSPIVEPTGSRSSLDSYAPLIVHVSRETERLKKEVFVLFCADCSYHINTVGCLAQVLKSTECHVVFDQLLTDDLVPDDVNVKRRWIKHFMDNCDQILIVNSEEAFRRTESIQSSSFELDMLNPDLDIFSIGVLILLEYPQLFHKVIMCHFEYTTGIFRNIPLRELQNQANYCLVEDINLLLYRLYPGSDETRPLTSQSSAREREALVNAVQHAKMCIRRTENTVPIAHNHSLSDCDQMFDALSSRHVASDVARSCTVPPTHPDDICTDEASMGGLVSDINLYPVFDSGYPATSCTSPRNHLAFRQHQEYA